MDILIGLLSILVVFGIGFLMSNDRPNINYRGLGVMIGLQFLLTFVLFNTDIGQTIILKISDMFNFLIARGSYGVNFVVGGIQLGENGTFIFNVLLIIIFFSTLLSILTYLKILPFIIKYLGAFLSKLTGMPKVESFNAVNSIFFGQSEALIAIKSQFKQLDNNRLFVVSASAMGSVAASIVGGYMGLIPPEYVLVALPLNMFSALIVSSLIAPVKVSKEEDEVEIQDVSNANSLFEAMGNGALDGGKIALIVAAMLIAFLATLDLVNNLISLVASGLTLQQMLGYIFYPFVWLMGVPADEVVDAGSIMGAKLITNEFAAMQLFTAENGLMSYASEKTIGIVSVFLTSFANFSSIGIIAGTVQGIDPEKGSTVSKFGLKLLVATTLASMLSATIAGIFLTF